MRKSKRKRAIWFASKLKRLGGVLQLLYYIFWTLALMFEGLADICYLLSNDDENYIHRVKDDDKT